MSNYKKLWQRATSPHPRTIELIALFAAVSVLVAGISNILAMSPQESTRDNVLPVINVMIGGLGVATLLFVWAQLRHTSTQSKLITYHEHFQDLPKASKVSAMYTAMARLNIERPLWQTPLSRRQREAITGDTTPAPDTAHIVIREYLNDFEEFAAALNCGLVDEDYAYHIENTRVLNAFYGYQELIDFWLLEDQERAARHRAAGVAPSDYYGELKKLAERWKGAQADRGRSRAAEA